MRPLDGWSVGLVRYRKNGTLVAVGARKPTAVWLIPGRPYVSPTITPASTVVVRTGRKASAGLGFYMPDGELFAVHYLAVPAEHEVVIGPGPEAREFMDALRAPLDTRPLDAALDDWQRRTGGVL